MKIAILSPFYPYRGGISQFSAMLYAVLQQKHEVKAFTFTRLYPNFLFPGKTQYVEDGDQAIPIPAERILDSINPFSYQTTVNKIEAFQPDIVVIAYWMSFFGPAYGHVANKLKKKTKVISLLHNAIPHEPRFFDKALAKLLFDRSKGFIVMSEAVKEDLLSIKPHAKYCLKPHPLYSHFGAKVNKSDAVNSLELGNEKKTLLFFGLIRDYKGLDLLIHAMSLLDDSYQLIIAGECYGSFEKYKEQIQSSPAQSRIKVLNQYIDDSEVPVLFSAADLLVLPYRSATQSGVISIAYYFDLPMLATNVGGLRESIEPCKTGIICEPNAESIAFGVNYIFQHGIDNYISNIKEEKKSLSWESFAEALVTFSEKL